MADSDERYLESMDAFNDVLVKSKVKDMTTPQYQEERFSDWDHNTCYDCGDDMHPDRLALGRVRCVHCQSIAEQLGDD